MDATVIETPKTDHIIFWRGSESVVKTGLPYNMLIVKAEELSNGFRIRDRTSTGTQFPND